MTAKRPPDARDAATARELRTETAQLHEAGPGAVNYYRGVNRRGRAEVPPYFNDRTHPDHRPAFAAPERRLDAMGRPPDVRVSDAASPRPTPLDTAPSESPA